MPFDRFYEEMISRFTRELVEKVGADLGLRDKEHSPGRRTLVNCAMRDEPMSVFGCPAHASFRRGACETDEFDARSLRSETIRTRNA